MKQLFLVAIFLFGVLSCGDSSKITVVNKGFYYWKNNSNSLESNEKKLIDSLSINRLYVKLFEVNYDSEAGIMPYAKSSLSFYFLDSSIQLIPCIYIRNNVFLSASNSELDELVSNILHLINRRTKSSYYSENGIPLKEIQFDCDWTETSKDKYFYFLRKFKKQWKKTLSCTLRLYPYKFEEKLGVPPCDKVTLMCYNLLNPVNSKDANSILEISELEKYILPEKEYPIPVDIALPLYLWNLCYDNDRFKGKIYGLIDGVENFTTKISPLWSRVERDTVIEDVYLRKGDRLKIESVSQESLVTAAKILLQNVKLQEEMCVMFFQLDEKLIKENSYEKINSVFSTFSN